MITISDILRTGHVLLDLKPLKQEEAILEVATLLKNDDRISDWTTFYKGLTAKSPSLAGDEDFQICIPHVRTDAVSQMVMSAGRSKAGIQIPGSAQRLHYIFVIGVPKALAADYLRIIGALARMFKDRATEQELRKTNLADEFVAILGSGEIAL